MNAFVKILEHLLAAIPNEAWPQQRFYPFSSPPSAPAHLFDACVFHQDASGALGMAWLLFPGAHEVLTLPFRIARYSQDGDLVSLPPWSLREATSDAEFYSTWKHAAQSAGHILTMKGGALQCRQFEGQSSFNIINLWTDNKNACTRVETQHLCKIFRVASLNQPHSIEAEILEYLNEQNLFLAHPELTTRYDLRPAHSDNNAVLPVAIVTRYIQSNTKLEQDLITKLQYARYPDPMRERVARQSWKSVCETVEKIGRLLAEFHIAMTKCRKNSLLNPEANRSEAKEKWLKNQLRTLNERIYFIRNHLQTIEVPLGDTDRVLHFGHDLFEKISSSDHLGLLIRIHGHSHLGQILVSDDGLYLVNYETDPMDEEEYRTQKQSGLKDIAAMALSLQVAWLSTEKKQEMHVSSNTLAHPRITDKRSKQKNFPQRYLPSLPDLENSFFRSYLQTLAEDATSFEMLPEKKADLENLYQFSFLLRVLKETVREIKNKSPNTRTYLRMLLDIVDGRLGSPDFENLLKLPSHAGSSNSFDYNSGSSDE